MIVVQQLKDVVSEYEVQIVVSLDRFDDVYDVNVQAVVEVIDIYYNVIEL